ncbi:MAG: aminopeptidase [Erysipelotrichaceae bacterium]|jgi:aminopeptidase|nr:aminopeptidase [Erysipelotrichaceae bacterium]
MDKTRLRNYARLIAEVGGNIQKGEEVWIRAGLEQPDFIAMLVEECYKLGAKRVVVDWDYQPLAKIANKYASVSELAKVTPYALARLKYRVKKLPTMIYIESEDPDGLKGMNQKKMAKASKRRYPRVKPFIDAMDDKYKWAIAAVPGLKWAKKVFPKLNDEDAVEALWEAILETSRANGNGIENWKKHNDFLAKQCKKLNDLHLDYLHYTSKRGTDFKVWMIEDAIWIGGGEYLEDKRFFNPNIPSEESFISPMKGKAEGTLVATKPLSYNGNLIENFSITFKDGKVVSVKAEKGQNVLEEMVKMDEGASMLGEVALVPDDSPISNSGLLFYNTLFDENAACHVALGRGFGTSIIDSYKYSLKELQDKGINESMIHVDFMIGSKDLDIVGYTKNGGKVQIFKNGNWAI